MTTATQILVAADAERSAARVADIELGLAAGDAVDQAWWREKARLRVQALDDGEADFGLLSHEIEERDRLKDLLAQHARRQADGGDQ